MSGASGWRPAPPAVRDRIRDEDSRLVERVVILLLAFWMGALAMAALAASAGFAAVDAALEKPSPDVAKAISQMGPGHTRALLRSQAGEANRGMFETWGWLQLGLTGVNFALLLLLTNAGKRVLGLAAAMAGLSLLIALYLVPGMERIAGELRAGPAPEASASFRTMHQAFGAFEAAAAVVAILLLAALLRGGARAGR